VLAYGNPSRQDDGLGPALAEALEHEALPNVTIDIDYQLTIENAAQVAEHDTVIFVDAAVDGREPFYFRKVEPKESASFSTHSVEPEAVLFLAKTCFDASPSAYVLGIRGYDFEGFGESLSGQAQSNLTEALDFINNVVLSGNFEQAVTEARN